MDTTATVIQQIVTDTLSFDSLNYKLTELKNFVTRQPSNSMLIPFLSAIAGGILVIAGQAIDRDYKQKLEAETNLREIYAFCRRMEALMKSNFRELAMAKVHAEYWWWYFNQTTISDSEKQKYYEEHLKSQSFAREIERRIGESKADFIAHVRKFQAIKELNAQIEIQLEEISDLTNAKAKTYDKELLHEKVRYQIVEQDEKELRETYYENLKNFKEINDYLQTLLKSKNLYSDFG